MKKTFLWISGFLFVYAIFECLCLGGLFLLKQFKDITYRRTVPSSFLSKSHQEIIRKLVSGQKKYMAHDTDLAHINFAKEQTRTTVFRTKK